VRTGIWQHLRTTIAGGTAAGVWLMSSVQQPAWAASPPAQKPNITDSEPTAIVQVENVATIPTDLLQVAENRAGEVFQKIGACVTWVDTTRAARRRIGTMFTLVLVNIEQSRSPYQRRQDVLGFAAPSVSRAWVFWDRIEAAKARAPATAIVLGDVMAHELGHLILASPGHSFRGIMRGEIPLRMRATETFTKRERLAILNRLQQEQAAYYRAE